MDMPNAGGISSEQALVIAQQAIADADLGGGGGGQYRGLLDCSPVVGLAPLAATVAVGGTLATDEANVSTLTMTELVSSDGDVYYASASGVGITLNPEDTVARRASFIWPDLSLDAVAVVAIGVHDNNTTTDEFLNKLAGQGVSSVYGCGAFVVDVSGSPVQTGKKTFINSVVSNSSSFSPPSAGQEVFFTLNQNTGEVLLYTADESYNETLAPFPANSMPDSDFVLSIIYGTGSPTTVVPSLVMNMGNSYGGGNGFGTVSSVPASIPDIAVDNDIYKCSVAGTILGKDVDVGDYIFLTTMKTDCIIIREPNGVPLTEEAVNFIISQALASGQAIDEAIQTALASVGAGINFTGTWTATSGLTQVSGLGTATISCHPVGAVAYGMEEFDFELPLTAHPVFGGEYVVGSIDNTVPDYVAVFGHWYTDVIVPNMGDDNTAQTKFVVELRDSTTEFFAIGLPFASMEWNAYDSAFFNTGGGSTSTVDLTGRRLRIRYNPTNSTLEAYLMPVGATAQSFVDYSNPLNVAPVNSGTLDTATLKACVGMRFQTDSPVLGKLLMMTHQYLVTPPLGFLALPAQTLTYRVTNADEHSVYAGRRVINDDQVNFLADGRINVMRFTGLEEVKDLMQHSRYNVGRTDALGNTLEEGMVSFLAVQDFNTLNYTVTNNQSYALSDGSNLDGVSFAMKCYTDSLAPFQHGDVFTVLLDTTQGSGGTVGSVSFSGISGEDLITLPLPTATKLLLTFDYFLQGVDGDGNAISPRTRLLSVSNLGAGSSARQLTHNFAVMTGDEDQALHVATSDEGSIVVHPTSVFVMSDGSAIAAASLIINLVDFTTGDVINPHNAFKVGDTFGVLFDTTSGTGGSIMALAISGLNMYGVTIAIETAKKTFLSFGVVEVYDAEFTMSMVKKVVLLGKTVV